MKKLLIQPYALAVVVLSMLGLSCSPEKVAVQTPTVDIQLVEELLPTSFTVKFVPEKGTARYDYGFGAKEDLESFKDGTLPAITNVKNAEEVTYKFTKELEEIQPNTEYFVFARAYDSKDREGDVSMYSIKTKKDDFTVTMSYVTDISAGFTVKTTEDYNLYYCALVSPDKVTDFMNDPAKADGVRVVKEDYLQTYNWFTLQPETEYVFVVKGWNRANVGQPKEIAIPVTTYAEGSDEFPSYTIVMGDNDFYMQNYIVTPNELCGKLLLRQEAKGYQSAFYESSHNGDFLKVLPSWEGAEANFMKCFTATGGVLNANPINEEMTLGAPFDVYVIAYDDTLPVPKPVGVKKFTNFSSPEPDMMLDRNTAKVESAAVDLSTITATSAEITIKVNEGTRMYMFEFYDEKAYNDRVNIAGFNKFSTFQDEMLKMYNAGSLLAAYRQPEVKVSWTGSEEDKLVAGKKYYLIVVPMNANGPITNGWGEYYAHEFIVPAN